MDPTSAAIMGLWAVSILSRITALVALVARRLVTRYPFLAVALAAGTVRSGVLVYSYLTRGGDGYTAAWASSQSLAIGLDCLLVAGAYLLMTRYARGLGVFGLVLIGAFVGLSVVIVAVTSGLFRVPETTAPVLSLCTTHYDSACLVTLWLSWGFFRSFGIRFAQNVGVHVRALTILFAGSAIGHQLRQIDTYNATAAAQLCILGGAIWAYWIWILRLRRSGETAPPPLPPMSEEEYREAQRRWERAVRRIQETLRDRWRLLLSA